MAQFKENNEYIGSPCVKICKYKKDFMEGNVCIGCFREQFEITNWVKMSNSEKQLVIKAVSYTHLTLPTKRIV